MTLPPFDHAGPVTTPRPLDSIKSRPFALQPVTISRSCATSSAFKHAAKHFFDIAFPFRRRRVNIYRKIRVGMGTLISACVCLCVCLPVYLAGWLSACLHAVCSVGSACTYAHHLCLRIAASTRLSLVYLFRTSGVVTSAQAIRLAGVSC